MEEVNERSVGHRRRGVEKFPLQLRSTFQDRGGADPAKSPQGLTIFLTIFLFVRARSFLRRALCA